MAINYKIRSSIVDINNDTPKDTDSFLIDSNVWFWQTYPSASFATNRPLPYQIQDYPAYLKKCLDNNAKLFHCIVSLNEVSGLIEKTEHSFYFDGGGNMKPKEYRHNNSNERTRIVSEIQSSWGQVNNISKPLKLTIDGNTADVVLTSIGRAPLDCSDGLIAEFMKENQIDNIITDDSDFACTPGIKVFTANKNVLIAAKKLSKLESRSI